MKSVVRVRDGIGRMRQLSVDEALDEASNMLSAGDKQNALLVLEKATSCAPFHARARHLLGAAQANSGNLKDAAVNLQKAVDADPNNAAFRVALGQTLMQLKPSDAIPHFLSAILLGAASPEAFVNLGLILLNLRRDEDALKVCDLSVGACQEHLAVLMNRAVALRRLGRFEEALACCRRQLELQPCDVRVWSNMGGVLRELGRLAEAADALERACLLEPRNSLAHYNLALTLLTSGDYTEGFREYEWRWQTPLTDGQRQSFVEPLWDGTFLESKGIFLYAEQGLGDTIQFVRYLPFVAKLGGRIVLAVPPSLVRLMGWLEGPEQVIPPGRPAAGFAVHCPLMSLPLRCQTAAGSIPAPASFRVPAALRENWAQRIADGKPKVGLVWAGSPDHAGDRHRSLPLHLLLPLLSVDEVDFFSLQCGAPARNLESLEAAGRPRDLSPFLSDFGETAAALCCMDLVIGVDTAVVHLAGSLGRPVWTLLPFAADWRWLVNRGDSPWYPSMRLFRQRTQGDWGSVIHEVRTAFGVWLLGKGPAAGTL